MIEEIIKIVKQAKELVLKPFIVEQKDGYANIVTTADKQVQIFLGGNICAAAGGKQKNFKKFPLK